MPACKPKSKASTSTPAHAPTPRAVTCVPVRDASKVHFRSEAQKRMHCLVMGHSVLAAYDTMAEVAVALATTYRNVLPSLYTPPPQEAGEEEEAKEEGSEEECPPSPELQPPRNTTEEKHGLVVTSFDGDERYSVVARGKCWCGSLVYTDQLRCIDERSGRYSHARCPSKQGGHLDFIKKWDAYWRARDVAWVARHGKETYFRK